MQNGTADRSAGSMFQKEDALKEFDSDKMTGAIRQKADALMRSEVAAYDSYLRGECYGFELYKNGGAVG